MKLPNTRGFSLLHVLPAILIVLAITAIGARIVTKSHAATTLSCAMTGAYPVSGGSLLNLTVNVRNTGNTTAYYTVYFRKNGTSRIAMPSSGGPHTNTLLHKQLSYQPGDYTATLTGQGSTISCGGLYRMN